MRKEYLYSYKTALYEKGLKVKAGGKTAILCRITMNSKNCAITTGQYTINRIDSAVVFRRKDRFTCRFDNRRCKDCL